MKMERWIPGTLSFRVLASYVDELIFDDGITRLSTAGDVGGTSANGVPRWRGTASASYAGDRFSTDLRARYVGGGDFNSLIGSDTSCDPVGRTEICSDLAARVYVDLGLQYALPIGAGGDSRVTFFGNVANLFDRDPPILPTVFTTIWSDGFTPSAYARTSDLAGAQGSNSSSGCCSPIDLERLRPSQTVSAAAQSDG